MRDFYAEFLESKNLSGEEGEQLPKLPKDPETGRNPTNGSSLEAALEDKNADSRLAGMGMAEAHPEGSNWIHQYNAIDVYQAKLYRVRRDPELAALVDTLCEERRAVMLVNGSTEQEADAYVSSLEFLAWALMNV